MPEATADDHRDSVKSFIVEYVLSTLLGGGLVWLAFRNEDWDAFMAGLRGVDAGLLGIYCLLFIIGCLTRILRWGILVRALGPISWRQILSAGAVGYMCIMVFPLRLGELVRPYLVRGVGGVTGSGALATVVVERVIDGLLFVALFFVFISMLSLSDNPMVEAVQLSAYIAGGFFLVTLAVLIGGYLRREATVLLVENIGNRIHRGLTARATGLLESFLDGLKILPDKRRIVWFVAMTGVYWALLGVSMKVMADAVGMSGVDYIGAFAILSVLVVGIMVPGGPGFTGTFELATMGGCSLLPLTAASVALVPVYTIVMHAVQLVIQVVAGAIFLLSGEVRLMGVVKEVNLGDAAQPQTGVD